MLGRTNAVTGGSKVTIDGEKVKGELSLTSEIVDYIEGSAPDGFGSGEAVVFENQIHIFSGSSQKHYKWDGVSWVAASTPPFGAEYATMAVFNGAIHALGCSATTSKRKYHYKWDGTTWTELPNLPGAISIKTGVVAYNDKLYVIDIGDYMYSWDGASWNREESSCKIAQIGSSGMYISPVIYDGKIHILGTGASTSNRTGHYKLTGNQWTEVSTIPYNAFSAVALVLDGNIHILNGNNTPNHYKWNGTVWTKLPDLPSSYNGIPMAVYKSRIHYLTSTTHYTIQNGKYVHTTIKM